MTTAYLWLNAALYAVFGVLCAVNPRGTAKGLGYSLSTHGGLSEYLTVYGGLQFGLAAFFAWTAMRDDLHQAGLVLALALYVPIVLFRWISVARLWPVERMTLGVGILEASLLAAALLLRWHEGANTAVA